MGVFACSVCGDPCAYNSFSPTGMVGHQCPGQVFARGDLVRKRRGAKWQGRIVGEYSTALTPSGYAVESDAHPGSVQIYPAAALERMPATAALHWPMPDGHEAHPAAIGQQGEQG